MIYQIRPDEELKFLNRNQQAYEFVYSPQNTDTWIIENAENSNQALRLTMLNHVLTYTWVDIGSPQRNNITIFSYADAMKCLEHFRLHAGLVKIELRCKAFSWQKAKYSTTPEHSRGLMYQAICHEGKEVARAWVAHNNHGNGFIIHSDLCKSDPHFSLKVGDAIPFPAYVLISPLTYEEVISD
ncbi:MAG TPA: hypothetical protein DCE56_02320 [Cyanobacteria bacterium UBA8553]|nr:hypothetical protein [Cyanobacteria bacterium UBA8553]